MSIQEHPDTDQNADDGDGAGPTSDGAASSFLQMFLEARPKRAE